MKFVICGDVAATSASTPYFEKCDIKELFHDVVNVFQNADRVLVNLECALTDSDNPIPKMGPNIKGPIPTAKALKLAGVTDCGLSNNHIFDYGIVGVQDTVKALEANGLYWTGFGENKVLARKDHIITHEGKTIILITVCEHEYSYALSDRMGAREYDPYDTMEDIRNAKQISDFVIVTYHGGKEFCEYPSPRLRKLCQAMVKNGADVVLCQHSHCIGCYEKIEGSHILYGQGNFHFVKFIDHPMWETGLVVELNINETCEISFVPVVATEHGIKLAKGELKEKLLASFYRRSEDLHNELWLKGWQDFCQSMAEHYISVINRTNNEDTEYFAHYLDCEAHTDVLCELYKTWNHTN